MATDLRFPGIVDQRNGQERQQKRPSLHSIQHRTGTQGHPASHRIEIIFQFAENVWIFEYLQIGRNDEVGKNGIRPGQIFRHVLRISQAEIAHFQLDPIGEQFLRQPIQERLLLSVKYADMIPVEQNMCHARSSPFRNNV